MNTPFTYLTRLFFAGVLLTLPALTRAQTVANDDYASALMNQSVLLDVVKNDNGTAIALDKIVLTNHGKATIEQGKIRFVPDADFKGVALLNYTIKNSKGEAACGLAIIDVAERPLPNYQEMEIFVVKNSDYTFTLPVGYNLTQNPGNGFCQSVGLGVWKYVNQGGADFDHADFSVNDNGTIKGYSVKFELLKTPNQFIFNDFFTTAIGKAVNIDVSANDGTGHSDYTFGACSDGTIENKLGGKLKFTPKANFSGKATFTYSAATTNGTVESGTVQIAVSDFLPAKEVYNLKSTGVPLVIHYPVAVAGFRFEPLDEVTSNGGTVKYYAQIDAVIQGYRIKDQNVLVYVPSAGNLNTDDFFVKYCVDATNCSDNLYQVVVDFEDPASGDQCANNCVWPGDTNRDGVVNMLDLFAVGNNMGAYGAAREVPNQTSWYPHQATNWGTVQGSTVDLKNADVNGDGVISEADADAIFDNYNKNSAITPTLLAEDSEVEIQLVSSASAARAGDIIEMSVMVGTAGKPAYATKGLSFGVSYNANQIKENSVSMNFGTFNWISRYDARLTLSKVVERGRIDAGLVRSRGLSTSGHGEIGKVRGVVEDDLHGFRLGDKPTLRFHLESPTMVGENGQIIKLKAQDLVIPLSIGTKTEPLKQDDLVMYPNPTGDNVNFYINGVNSIQYVRLMDATGREVMRQNNVDAKSATLQVTGVSAGFYITEVMTEKGRIVKKLEIFK